MRLRRTSVVAAIALGAALVGAPAASALPAPRGGQVLTAGCVIGGETVMLEVVTQGAVAFVLEDGRATGEKLFLLSLDAAAFTDAGQLVDEFHRAYGERKGLGEPFFCSGSFPGAPGTTVFFDALVAPQR